MFFSPFYAVPAITKVISSHYNDNLYLYDDSYTFTSIFENIISLFCMDVLQGHSHLISATFNHYHATECYVFFVY